MIVIKYHDSHTDKIFKDGGEVGHIDWVQQGGKPKLRTTGQVAFTISEVEAILEQMKIIEGFQVQYREPKKPKREKKSGVAV